MNNSQVDSKLIHMLSDRLERISVDSIWAHRASGIRRALIRNLEEIEMDHYISAEETEDLLRISLVILEKAAREKLRNFP